MWQGDRVYFISGIETIGHVFTTADKSKAPDWNSGYEPPEKPTLTPKINCALTHLTERQQ